MEKNPASPSLEPSRWTLEPMEEKPTLLSVFESLLKQPGRVLHELLRDGGGRGKLIACLLGTAMICLAIFGLVVGSFSLGAQLWASPVKIAVGTGLSALICLPSLYIFSCLAGHDAKPAEIAGVLVAMICLVAVLLLGFAPVLWVFSQSTKSAAFMGALLLAFWLVALGFGVGWLRGAWERLGGRGSRSHLAIWIVIFGLVSLQMSTTLRPIVGSSDAFLSGEKKFFLKHWIDVAEGREVPVRDSDWQPVR